MSDSTEHVINLKRFQSREACLRELNSILKQFQDVAANLTDKIEILSTAHNDELKKMNNLLNGSRSIKSSEPSSSPKRILNKSASSAPADNTQSWSVVAAGGRRKKESPARIIGSSILSEIPISSQYSLTAIRVDDWATLDHMADGVLYYVDSCDTFAIVIAGQFMYGNIGRVYTDEKEPTKIKDCKYGEKCFKGDCGYYHSPTTAHGRKDRRNFIASSWLYSANDFLSDGGRKARRFGDRANIDKDLPYMTEEENERFVGQTMHDILCSLLLFRYGHLEMTKPKN